MNLPTFNIPPVGPCQGKVWGKTRLVFAFNSTEAHLIRARKGGYCSRHSHDHKWNRFLVIEGRLIVRIFLGQDQPDETIIEAGQITDVPPGVRHEFEAAEDTVAIEFYWVELSPADIDRGGTQGGMRE